MEGRRVRGKGGEQPRRRRQRGRGGWVIRHGYLRINSQEWGGAAREKWGDTVVEGALQREGGLDYIFLLSAEGDAVEDLIIADGGRVLARRDGRLLHMCVRV